MEAKRFEYISHTADVAFLAYGKDFNSALENAAFALLNLMLDIKRIKSLRAKKREVHIEDMASTKEDLVWYLLQDILSKVDAEKLNAYDFQLKEIREMHGKIKATGKLTCKDDTGDFALLSLKAVTPHDLNVNQGKAGWSIKVVADV